jgi:hypothetical protein
MKKIDGDTKNRVLGLCMLIATLFGSAVAKADVVLDWNVDDCADCKYIKLHSFRCFSRGGPSERRQLSFPKLV